MEVTAEKYRAIVVKGSITLKKQAFKIFRKRLSIDNVDINNPASIYNFNFNLSPALDFSSQKATNWGVAY